MKGAFGISAVGTLGNSQILSFSLQVADGNWEVT